MKFWKRLRWIATAVFLMLLFAAWMDSPDTSQRCDPFCIGRPAPIF